MTQIYFLIFNSQFSIYQRFHFLILNFQFSIYYGYNEVGIQQPQLDILPDSGAAGGRSVLLLPDEQTGRPGDKGETRHDCDYLPRRIGTPGGTGSDGRAGEKHTQHGTHRQRGELLVQRPLADTGGTDHHHARQRGGAVLGHAAPQGTRRTRLPACRSQHPHREG